VSAPPAKRARRPTRRSVVRPSEPTGPAQLIAPLAAAALDLAQQAALLLAVQRVGLLPGPRHVAHPARGVLVDVALGLQPGEEGLEGAHAPVPLIHQSIIGSPFIGKVVQPVELAEREAVITEIEGSAWLTGYHTFILEPDHPLGTGFLLR
jgi:hypothetical protein